jgi:Ca2+-binding EF-hand superfamily protein
MATEAQRQELREKATRLVNDRFGGDYDRAWAHYDGDQDGRVNRDELQALLKDAGIGNWLTRGAWTSGIIEALDADADGTISAAEFQAAIR